MNVYECERCRGRAENAYLCRQCVTDLRRQLLGLPTLLGHLEDTALGMTRLGNEASRQLGYESRQPSPDERAARLLADIRSTVGQWAVETAKRHALVVSPPVSWARPIADYKPTTGDYAVFLAAHVDRLAVDPDIGDLCASLRSYIKRALAVVNRRTPPQFCGPCPAPINDHKHCTECTRRTHDCGTRLMARRGAIEVVCPTCQTTHRVERLVNELLARADDFRCTIPELHRVLRMLGTPVALRTLYHWALPRVGRLKPAGYLRPDNKRIGPTRHTVKDTPVYRVSEARKVAAESGRNGRNGRPLKGGNDARATG